jgi:hypothetical protein
MLFRHGRTAVDVPKEPILKEMAADLSKLSQHFFLTSPGTF